ncbi:MAG: Uma2 family endonuclease [Thermosynechococcaceae cyanobacterium]
MRQYHFDEYLTYSDGTDHRYELVAGQLRLVCWPTFRHLLLAKFIEQQLDAETNRLGHPWLCLREVGLRTGWQKSRLSDVYVITTEQVVDMLDESAVCQTPPLLVVEVVSPESVKRDYRYKRSEYAALGVPEYWIVDPLTSKVSVLQLNEGLYDEAEYRGEQAIASPTFPDLQLTVTQILRAGEPQQ